MMVETEYGPVEFRLKGFWWKVFRSYDSFTTIGRTIWCPGHYPVGPTLDHELIHVRQQEQVGLVKYIFLYLFCLPLFYNPWRWKWEKEAYLYGSRYSSARTERVLRSSFYGWLRKPF